ncbi:hypothetical protein ISS05_04135 [Candidatus Woesearchaeota archaeon]|nr:hypothetical protein [Candidatus Woesearchaeota archaeon]
MNLDDLTIETSQVPVDEIVTDNLSWRDYFVQGKMNGIPVGSLRITRAIYRDGAYEDEYFFDLTQNPPASKLIVARQDTEEKFRGKNICGAIIQLANQYYKKREASVLHSDIHFPSPFTEQSKKVWKKLEKSGLAVFQPYLAEDGKQYDRWVMF